MDVMKPAILVVDDASNWRITLETLLKSYGYQITVAANVIEASEALSHGPFTAAILDVRLDAFDDTNHEGVSTVLASAHKKFPQMSFIILSSYFNETDVRNFAPRDTELYYFDKNNLSIDQLLNTLHLLVKRNAN
jgi:DNA-binding NtrC family response regulator